MRITYLVKVKENKTLRALIFKKLLSLSVKTRQLVLSLSDDPLKGTQVTGRGTLVKKVEVEMLGDRVFASGDGLEESGLSATVLTEETVSFTVGKLESGIGDKNSTVEDQRATGHLDVLAGLGRRQDTGGDTVRDTMLVHLLSETLHLVEFGARSRGGILVDDGVAVSIELRLCVLALLAALELALGSLLSETLLLGRRGSHDDDLCVRKKKTAGLKERRLSAGWMDDRQKEIKSKPGGI